MQRVFAIAFLTVKAAIRFRLFVVLAGLLLAVVFGLPVVIKTDGTAQGFIQIMLTYTLGLVMVILGFTTLWLACGTLARDVEECQMQLVAVKPVARWQIWLGKWLGIMLLNAALLAMSGAAIYGLLLWRADRLPPAEQTKLRNEILVARASLKPQPPDFGTAVEKIYEQRRKASQAVAAMDPAVVRQQIRQALTNDYELVPSGMVQHWVVNFGVLKDVAGDRPLFLQVKFHAAQKSPTGTFIGLWRVGVPQTPRLWQPPPMSLAPDTVHELRVPPHLIGDDGKLSIDFANLNDTALTFPIQGGIEVLYRQGGFGPNYVRGLVILYLWLALLAAVGLASASALSFPVAAFLALALLIIGLSGGLLKTILYEGSVLGVNHNTGRADHPTPVDYIFLPLFRGLLHIIDLVYSFSPIDLLSSGRAIPWTQMGLAVLQIGGILCGFFGLVGIVLFTRRELATAQANQ
jgi:hypothetical protein